MKSNNLPKTKFLTNALLLATLFSISGCLSSSDEAINEPDPDITPDKTLDDGTKLVGLPVTKIRSLFSSDSATSSEQYIRNYLIKNYSQVIESYDYYLETTVDSAPVAEASLDASDGAKAITSTTNTIEDNVDEADLIKAFSENGQDYLVTISQPEQTYFYEFNEASVERYKKEQSPAQLNLYSIDTSPASSLLSSSALNEDAYYVSGIYTYQSQLTSEVNNTQLIAQTSLRESPTDWSDYQSWQNGRTGIEATQLNTDSLSSLWSMTFEGHLLDSRRIENHLYVALRHNPNIIGLERAYAYNGSENTDIIANNIAVIEELDIQAMLPNITLTNNGSSEISPVFTLESCHLPNNEERFSSGSVVFNYVAKVDLDTGSVVGVQCILSEINQIYMNEESLFFIDANQWSTQTSRLHRFSLTDLTYDSSLTVEGTLGWRSAEFRIKELTDGTVVLITSKPENEESQSWCCWFNNNWIHKLQLFQKDGNQDYQKIAELPNESQPDNDDTPQSLGKAGEDIYGVRIDENSVKVVTFQQTDPLYVFDISDRNNPIFSGELADTGFSAYLHSFDDLILGIGFDANENGNSQGLKVELYKADSSEENGIISITEHVFGTSANTPVNSNHHAFTSLDISDDKTRISIPATVYEDYQWSYTGLLLFSLDKANETLTFDGKVTTNQSSDWLSRSSWTDRSVIQHSEEGSVVHYIHNGEVTSTAWETAN